MTDKYNPGRVEVYSASNNLYSSNINPYELGIKPAEGYHKSNFKGGGPFSVK